MPVQLETLQPSPPKAMDNSVLSCAQRCPRKAFYQYVINRAPAGDNYPIGFGLGYHSFREVIEKAVMNAGLDYEDPTEQKMIFMAGLNAAYTQYPDDPPVGHKKEYLTQARLKETCTQAFDNWLREKRQGRIKVLESERAFTLFLPSGRPYGGRFDQIISWNKRLWVRDFKTTSRMGSSYAEKFDPENQLSGYVWAAQELSGRKLDGVMVETVYNTKTKGPEFHPLLVTRTPFHIEQWLETVEADYDDWEKHLEENIWPMRTVACNDYGGCYYRGACRKDGWATLEDWLLSETIESHWDFTNPDAEEGVVD